MSQPENNPKSLIQDAKDLIDKTQTVLDKAKEVIDHPETVLDIAKQIIQKPTTHDAKKESDGVKPDPTESNQ